MAAPASLPCSPRAGELDSVVREAGVVEDGLGEVGAVRAMVGVVGAEEVVEDSPRAPPFSPITEYSMMNSVFTRATTSPVFIQSQLRLSSKITSRDTRTRCVTGLTTRYALAPSA